MPASGTSRDPAVNAARRAWKSRFTSPDSDSGIEAWGFEKDVRTNGPAVSMTLAAREALAPIRELHRKAAIFEHVDGCDNDDAEHESLWHFEAANGEMVCESLPVLGWTCGECAEVADLADDLPEWPCATAKLIYTSEELNHD
ncbi:hypothetical protein SEA_FINKLE_75 [Gordonia phage Finkle]|uniref:Uncharacterized protein n=1 Tax=Gordonia phage Finkle TaxID=2926099 RepID=A0A9E7NK08_9CAUD|nr:hypothetical protein QEH33_gp75 [Gordonia phage Finkle]UTN92989.1 hypothetical protein SEA_FINKLE_75 [Gordonia phage Finkle]